MGNTVQICNELRTFAREKQNYFPRHGTDEVCQVKSSIKNKSVKQQIEWDSTNF